MHSSDRDRDTIDRDIHSPDRGATGTDRDRHSVDRVAQVACRDEPSGRAGMRALERMPMRV